MDLPCVGLDDDDDFGTTEDAGIEFEVEDDARYRAALFLFRTLDSADTVERFYLVADSAVESQELDRGVLESLGLPLPTPKAWEPPNRQKFIRKALARIRQHREAWEKERPPMPIFDAALASFRSELGFSPVEMELLEFVALMYGLSWLRAAFADVHGSFGQRRCMELLANALGTSVVEAAHSISQRSKLIRGGLVLWESDSMDTLPYRLGCPSALPRALLVEGAGPHELLAKQCRPAPETQLTLDNFSYLERETRIVTRLLREAGKRGSVGVNILLYGEPGTGKTELARVVAAAAGASAWEIGCRDHEENAASDRERLSYLRFGQSVMDKNPGRVLLFDEAEDVFPHEEMALFGIRSPANRNGKAWFNQLLESNPVPTIWLSNSTRGIDDAHLRRFLYVLEVPRPPRQARRHILEAELAPLGVPKPWLEQISADERLVPGHIARAKRLIEHLGALAPEEAREAAEQGLVNTLRATRQGRRLKSGDNALTRYSPEFLNADTDLDALTHGVAERGAGRLCFYGPPGTGKSAFARHLAERAGKPLVYRRASDLLSMWVGGTEENIARMFEEADREGGAILLDEADSFLASRAGASKSWEITQVNELLTQMEAFEGLFMASTNLMERLDFASLRRFDQKIHFGYLQPEQARMLLLQVLKEHGIKPRKPDRPAVEKVANLSNLTPGDFAAIIRRARLNADSASVGWWLTALEQECAIKPDQRRGAMGFV